MTISPKQPRKTGGAPARSTPKRKPASASLAEVKSCLAECEDRGWEKMPSWWEDYGGDESVYAIDLQVLLSVFKLVAGQYWTYERRPRSPGLSSSELHYVIWDLKGDDGKLQGVAIEPESPFEDVVNSLVFYTSPRIQLMFRFTNELVNLLIEATSIRKSGAKR